jgi:hypothetical protein
MLPESQSYEEKEGLQEAKLERQQRVKVIRTDWYCMAREVVGCCHRRNDQKQYLLEIFKPRGSARAVEHSNLFSRDGSIECVCTSTALPVRHGSSKPACRKGTTHDVASTIEFLVTTMKVGAHNKTKQRKTWKQSTIKTTMSSTSNSWEGKQGQWKGDGTANAVLEDKGNNVVGFASPTRGSPFNIYYDMKLDDSITTVDGYYEVVIEKLPPGSSLSVGLVTPEECQSGWKAKGCFYNGNLTNGSAALVTSFGPHLKEKDRVGVRCIRSGGETMDVVHYINGRCLGKGFQLSSAADVSSAPYYPCLHVSGEAEVGFSIPASLPSTTDRGGSPRDGFAGDWQLSEAVDLNGQAVALPDTAIIMKLAKGDAQTYSLSIKVGNSMNSKISLTSGSASEGDSLVGVGIEVGPFMSTMMMPRPELRAVETYVSKSFQQMNIMSLNEDGSLVFEGSGAKAVFRAFGGRSIGSDLHTLSKVKVSFAK